MHDSAIKRFGGVLKAPKKDHSRSLTAAFAPLFCARTGIAHCNKMPLLLLHKNIARVMRSGGPPKRQIHPEFPAAWPAGNNSIAERSTGTRHHTTTSSPSTRVLLTWTP